MTTKIENLKKIHLTLHLADKQSGAVIGQPKTLTFIYGAASAGLTPFESCLAGMATGDQIDISLSQADMAASFGHLLHAFKDALGLHIMPQQIRLNVTVSRVAEAEQREIVQAMAGALGSGCGGGCDCGCS